MRNYHCVMTIQPTWGGADAVGVSFTHTEIIKAATAEALYEAMLAKTTDKWSTTYPNKSFGKLAVIHWSFSPNYL